MASPTTPQHGRHGAIYRLRPNGFSGAGLNDVTWGTAYSAADSAFFEVEIDAEGTPDTFKWRKDGGAYTATVAITGAAQALSDTQTITFAATTGHTLLDEWTVGNLFAEPCTASGASAQITDTTKRILDPNNPPVFTDDGGKTVLRIDYTTGTAYFTGNVGTVTVAGNLGQIETSGLEKVGYLTDWSFNITLDLADQSYMGQKWKHNTVGQGSGTGSASSFFIGSDSMIDGITNKEFFFLQLFNYDPDQDQTGDHFNCWVLFSGDAVAGSVGDNVKETLDFTIDGTPSFTANV
ncbi:MAG: hypothetical protein HOJ48_05750 [Desulfobacula sp.]|jgi:hypothetical protein|nr:hypothetical protein [Desulfobacula sp.]